MTKEPPSSGWVIVTNRRINMLGTDDTIPRNLHFKVYLDREEAFVAARAAGLRTIRFVRFQWLAEWTETPVEVQP